MKYVANPVVVDAFEITEVGVPDSHGMIRLECSDGQARIGNADMTARMKPVAGDFWVIQEDGYHYLNPREVFLRKYRLLNTFDPVDNPVVESDGDAMEIRADGTIIGRAERVEWFRKFCAERGALLTKA